MDNISGDESTVSVDTKLVSAERYIQVAGWRIFVVRENKRPFPSCTDCDNAELGHDREACQCLVCHSHYAATTDMDRVRAMFERYPDALLAARTGQISGIFAIDFDTKPRPSKNPNTGEDELVTGIDVLEQWHSFTGGVELPPTLTARTRSGGFHLIYQSDSPLTSRNGILPSVDIKANGGYVVLAPAPGRWWHRTGLPTTAPDALVNFLTDKRGGSFTARRAVGTNGRSVGGSVAGSPLASLMTTGCPASGRDEFANTLIFQLRKIGMSYDDTLAIMREQWQLMEQTSDDFFHWHYIVYKMDKIWRTVTADVDGLPAMGQQALMQALSERRAALHNGEVVQVGRRAIVRHPGYGKR